MNSLACFAEACPYRQTLRQAEAKATDSPLTTPTVSAEHATTVCALARRFVSGVPQVPETACQVNDATCNACFASGKPDTLQLNTVVASLIFKAVSETLASSTASSDAAERLLLEQICEFSRQRLARPVNDDAVLSPHLSPAHRPPSPGNKRLSERWSQGFSRRWSTMAWLSRGPRIGLVGRNSPYGLGHQNRDLVQQLHIEDWLAPFFREDATQPIPEMCQIVPQRTPQRLLEAFVDRVDALMFIERPMLADVTRIARQRGTPVVCVPNWEWIRPATEWLADVDLMLCPCRHTFDLLSTWKRRFGFDWALEVVPWPIPVRNFPFRLRKRCQSFVFVGGKGGCRAELEDGRILLRRKGLDLVMQTAERMRSCTFRVYTTELIRRCPANVELRGFTSRNGDLYSEGDVCIQPSYWEGLGLPLLECQAAGMPLVTSDMAPMNEYKPLAVIPAMKHSIAHIGQGQRIVVPEMRADDLVGTLEPLVGRDIAAASRRAREFAMVEHSWSSQRRQILTAIERVIADRRGSTHSQKVAML